MKTYKPRKDWLIYSLLTIVILLPLPIFISDAEAVLQRPWILLALWSPLPLLLWIFFDTAYAIKEGKLYYRSAFIKGNLDIQTIRKVDMNSTMWSGIKPALATKGMIIYFNRFDEIYIAPENNEAMISDLLEINPEIQVVSKTS